MENSIIREVYGKGAEIYEEIMKKYWHVERGPFIDLLMLKPGQKILEAVVGTGLDLSYFPKGTNIVGIDITSKMLDEARKKSSPATIELKKMDIHSIEFPDNYFDCAVSTFTLCVVRNSKKALEEILRTTKHGSKIAILDYCKSKNTEVAKWQELINYHAANIGFPKDVIVWDSMMDYDKLIYDSGLPIEVESDDRIESENPFKTACQIILINKK